MFELRTPILNSRQSFFFPLKKKYRIVFSSLLFSSPTFLSFCLPSNTNQNIVVENNSNLEFLISLVQTILIYMANTIGNTNWFIIHLWVVKSCPHLNAIFLRKTHIIKNKNKNSNIQHSNASKPQILSQFLFTIS